MNWWSILLIAALVIQFSFVGWVAWQTRDTHQRYDDDVRHDPSRASWTSGVSDMQGDG